jgi:pyrimidine-nucleoside phosphorylase
MPFVDVIARKRDGQELSRDEIERFVVGATDGTVPDYQTSALLMAVVLRGMTDQETTWLTDARVRSGSRVDLSDLPGVKVGKHSTGGVGDKVSIALAPLAAACGVLVPKMSGRGLGHTGGTLDKLESIPGFRVGLEIPEFKAVLREVGTCIIGQTTALAPADRKLYALRDVTATVESVPLIAASIMSKKLAEGSSALVLDVKCGRGAFMKDAAGARALASTMVAIGNRAGIATEAVITRMDSPLGAAVGNSVEIAECLRVLKGDGPSDLTALVMTLAARMVVLAGEPQEARAAVAVRRALESGAGLETLRRMIERQGGDARVVDDSSRLPAARHRTSVCAERGGWLGTLDATLVGRAAAALGAGRERVDDAVDHGAGILVRARPGEQVRQGDEVLDLLYNDERRLERARTLARRSVQIVEEEPAVAPLVLESIR